MRENQKCSDSIMKLSQRTFMLKFKPCKLQQQFYRTFLLVPQNSIKMHLILFSKEKISFDNNYSWVNFISKLLRQRLISRLNKIGHDQISFFPRARVQVNHDQGWLRDWQFFCLANFLFLKTASDLSDGWLQCLQHGSADCSKKCVNKLTPQASHKWDVPLSLKSYQIF